MTKYRLILAIALPALTLLQTACREQTDVSFFVLVKSSNYAQDAGGQLTLLNYHFFSEIFLNPSGTVMSASLSTADIDALPGASGSVLSGANGPGKVMEYEDRGDAFYVEGGHFETLEEVDAAYPNGRFRFDISAPTVSVSEVELSLEGPSGRTDIPAPILITLFQDGQQVSPVEIEAKRDLVIRWSDYSNGAEDPRGIVDDMIFVVVADCHGERLFHTGLPFQGEYLTYRATEVLVEAGTLAGGQAYSSFVEFPHVVDSRIVRGVPGFTSYATATYLDLHTAGPDSGSTCPQTAPPMDTGQTDRMDPVGRPGADPPTRR
jgi:hypothetical protein